jgi:hypothetical protein
MTEFLIKHGANFNASILGSLPLRRILGSRFQIEDEVAEANEDPIVAKIDCLFEAIGDGDSEKVLQLLEDINANEPIKANEDPIVVAKIGCITRAMCDGDSEKALQLLEDIEDKDINRRGRGWQITLLGAASIWNHMNVAQVLLERGANLHMKCFDPDEEYCGERDQFYGSCTPFGIAILEKNKKMIKFFIEHGANVNTLIWGRTPLQRILGNYFHLDDNYDDDYFVITYGDDWPQLDRDCFQVDDDKHEGVYRHPGRNYLWLNNKGLKIINDYCSENILKEMQLFIKKGADVNARDREGDTILHYLAGSFSHGGPFSFKFADLLFEEDADPRRANNEGELPLQQFKLSSYVVKRFPERMKNYCKLRNMFHQRIDELNAKENKCSKISLLQRKKITHNAKRAGNSQRNLD